MPGDIASLPDLPFRFGEAHLPYGNRAMPDSFAPSNLHTDGRQQNLAFDWHFVIEEYVSDPEFSIGQSFYGQFTAQNFNREVSNNLVEGGGYSRSQPLVMW